MGAGGVPGPSQVSIYETKECFITSLFHIFFRWTKHYIILRRVPYGHATFTNLQQWFES